MRTIIRSTRRLTTAGAFAAMAAAPLAAAIIYAPSDAPAYLGQCNGGEEGDPYTGQCVPYLVPNSPAGNSTPSGCPAGVTGAECADQNQPVSSGPNMPAPVQPQQPEQQLADVVTPDY
jgi:hypothetical protein